jgi:RNA polymerase sigma-70 factor (ECF subfamily)
VQDAAKRARFEQVVLPHLDAAYNLARWLTRKEQDAEDVVQEACLRAFQFLDGFRGTDARAWLLTIVRNTCYTWLERNRAREPAVTFDETKHSGSVAASPESAMVHDEDKELLRRALEELPVDYREVIVLRELEGLSYREIATVANIAVGTVMSRLARARGRLQSCLAGRTHEGP